MDPDKIPSLTKKKRGRPTNAELAEKGVIPASRKKNSEILANFKREVLDSNAAPAVIAKLFEVALDDEHKNQAVALKMLGDRLLPVASFEPDKKTGGTSGINITISTSGSVNMSDTMDGEFEEVGDVEE